MTFAEALKVAQRKLGLLDGNFMGDSEQDEEAAAVLARLEAELPKWRDELVKLDEEMSDGSEDGGEVLDAPADAVGTWLTQVRWLLSRLDAAPKEES